METPRHQYKVCGTRVYDVVLKRRDHRGQSGSKQANKAVCRLFLKGLETFEQSEKEE